MSVIDAIEKLKPSLRHTRYAINGRGGEISDTAGMKDLRDAIFNIPADNAITTVTVEEIGLGGEIPENTTGYAYIAEFGGMCHKLDDVIFQETLSYIASYGAGYDWDTVDSIDSFLVPNEIEALDGYGLGISPEYYNKVDLVNRKYHYCVEEVVFDGSEGWYLPSSVNGTINAFYTVKLPKNPVSNRDALMSHYDYAEVGVSTTAQGWMTLNTGYIRVRPHLSAYPSAEAWKAHLAELYANGNPLTLIYALAEPIVTDLPVYVNPLIKVESGGYGLEMFPSEGQGMPYKIIMQTYTQ